MATLLAAVNPQPIRHIEIEDSVVVTATGCEELGDVDGAWCVAVPEG